MKATEKLSNGNEIEIDMMWEIKVLVVRMTIEQLSLIKKKEWTPRQYTNVHVTEIPLQKQNTVNKLTSLS